MPINQSFLGELGHELATTRKVLSRLPDGKFDWKPHEKSMTLGQLASHLTEMHTWGPVTLATQELDLAPVDGPKREGFRGQTAAEVLAKFDEAAAELQRALAAATDDADWLSPWTLKVAGQTMFTLPKVGVIRGMIFNHIVHHRGQLSVYLRMLDVPVPALYGPSADER
ncbi:MAG: DinB family protein [Bryobacterales bacterium]|nr:DinB family protein [Bryobacterales bacterium]